MMKRWIAGIAALVGLGFGTPAIAQTGDQADAQDENALEVGLYEGSIGNLPVHVCFSDSFNIRGTYYYLKHLKPIGLLHDEKDRKGVLAESIGYGEGTGDIWTISKIGEAKITGTWRGNKRELPITLKRVDYTKNEYTGPCESVEFLAPRMDGGTFKETAAQLGAVSYTQLNYVPSKGFDRDHVDITGFALKPTQAGDGAINALLRKHLPDGTGASDFAQCMGAMHAIGGRDGDFYREVKPEFVTKEWLVALISRGTYCGGAHPSYWQDRQVFDRRSGEQVDMRQWLRPDAVMTAQFEGVDGSPKTYVRALSEPLYKRVVAHWPKEQEECLKNGPSTFFSWSFGLAKEGIIFLPSVAHVMTPCAESITVPWDELAPYLSEEGQAVRDSVR